MTVKEDFLHLGITDLENEKTEATIKRSSCWVVSDRSNFGSKVTLSPIPTNLTRFACLLFFTFGKKGGNIFC